MHKMVPLHVMTYAGRALVWDRFLDTMDAEFTSMYHVPDPNTRDKLFEQHLASSLETYGATTDWTNDSDPVWFPDSEQLTEFVLTYS
jgi:hypothetical protein